MQTVHTDNKEKLMKTDYLLSLCKRLSLLLVLALLCSSIASAKRLEMRVDAGQQYVKAGSKHVIPVKISLTGFTLPVSSDRAPVNVSLVIDRSGSMSGEKIANARKAAIAAISHLRDSDIVSVITYDSSVQVVVPATKLTDRSDVIRKLQSISVGGSTALFAGVSKGSSELRKFLDRQKVNRVVLLSDGIANVGPSTPGELGRLGMSLAQDGISVSTIGLGLGYNEDLMAELANRSDGNHKFVEHPYQLASIFNKEFNNILSVVAQDIQITINCANGVRPVRVLGLNADIHGQQVVTSFNQLYAEQEKYLVLEVEIPAHSAGVTQQVASVDVLYANMNTKLQDSLSRSVKVAYSHSADQIRRNVNKHALESYYDQLANSISEEAVVLRDRGDKKGAQELFKNESMKLRGKAKEYNIPKLEERAKQYDEDASRLDTDSWGKQRKQLRSKQYQLKKQQTF
jgi:Ca-activated chloride channel family protein